MDMAEKLVAVAENVQKVYEAGQKSEHDRFWDAYQENGKRTTYTAAFSGIGWTAETFKPKYDIVPENATQMFGRYCLKNVDLVEHLNNINKKLDFSECKYFVETFFYTNIVRVGIVDTRKCANLSTILAYSADYLKTVDELILKDDGSQTFSNSSFIQSTGLTNIKVTGVIGKTVNFQWSTKLTAKSIVSIVEALSSTTSGLTLTLSQAAVNNADWTTTDYANFEALEATKTNWTITLV